MCQCLKEIRLLGMTDGRKVVPFKKLSKKETETLLKKGFYRNGAVEYQPIYKITYGGMK